MAKYDKADLERRMKGAVESLRSDLSGLRTGRANTALLDPITVEVYGAHMPLNQVATVSVPEPRLISIQVWDRSNISPVEKAVRSANLGINPITDGQAFGRGDRLQGRVHPVGMGQRDHRTPRHVSGEVHRPGRRCHRLAARRGPVRPAVAGGPRLGRRVEGPQQVPGGRR